MGTWTIWIAFNVGVALLLLLDLSLFHRAAHAISLREAATESAIWVLLSTVFGFWIFFSHGRGPGLEFFAGYVIEKSLSVDNIFVFLLVFRFFRVDPRYQHRLLYWGVLGALLLRGAMIGAGTLLIHRFEWILYLFGVFLLYAGFKLFGADHAVHPEKNPIMQWMQKILPMSQTADGPDLFVREGGRWLATRLFLVVVVLETTDLVFAVDSIPAVFGVTRDPFLVYSSNVCAILGLRAFYFLLAGILPYFQYLDEGLAIVLMFIGAKMLADPWVHISTGLSLAIVGAVIAISVFVSVVAAKSRQDTATTPEKTKRPTSVSPLTAPMILKYIYQLADPESRQRDQAAQYLFSEGTGRISKWLADLEKDQEFHNLLVQEKIERAPMDSISGRKLTVGIAVLPETFDKIRAANSSPELAEAPADQEVLEFELEFAGDRLQKLRLDILTTSVPGGKGAIARFLEKFGEGIQQVEIDVTDVDRATDIVRTRFNLEPAYPATRAGANGTRVNFILVPTGNDKKVLVEFVEYPSLPSST